MKKKILILFTILATTSCVTIPYVEKVYFLDYSFFHQKNFFVTESPFVGFDYTTVGSIVVVISSGDIIQEKTNIKKGQTEKEPKGSDELYSVRKDQKFPQPRRTKFKAATTEEAFKLLYEKALSEGANGILNLKTTRDGSELSVSGMLIKH